MKSKLAEIENQAEIDNLFLAEGVDPTDADYKDFKEHKTWVVKDEQELVGFFTMRKEHGLPFLTHMLVKKKYRTINTARFFIKEFVEKVRQSGFSKAIVHAPESNIGVQKLLCHYFRKPFYGSSNGNKFMLVEV